MIDAKLRKWLDSDRDRRSVVITVDDQGELWQVFLCIDDEIVTFASGVDLIDTIGMVVGDGVTQ